MQYCRIPCSTAEFCQLCSFPTISSTVGRCVSICACMHESCSQQSVVIKCDHKLNRHARNVPPPPIDPAGCTISSPFARRSDFLRGKQWRKASDRHSTRLATCSSAVCVVRMAEVKVDPVVFWERIMKLHKTWNVRQSSERPLPCAAGWQPLTRPRRVAERSREGRPVQGR